MLFKPELCEKILSGAKTMTRRLVKSGEWLTTRPKMGGGQVKVVYDANRKTKWEVGRSYAIQPGRGVAAVGRFTLLDIRRERLQDISEADAIAEGVTPFRTPTGGLLYVPAFASLWNEINGPGSFGDNPEVWALTFEVAK